MVCTGQAFGVWAGMLSIVSINIEEAQAGVLKSSGQGMHWSGLRCLGCNVKSRFHQYQGSPVRAAEVQLLRYPLVRLLMYWLEC